MNIIFTFFVTLSIVLLTFINPNAVLKTFSSSASDAVSLCITLISVYAVFMGIINVIKDSKLLDKFSKLLTPLIKKIFHTKDEETVKELTLNLSANLLGVGAVATPSAINAIKKLDEQNNENGKNLLFIISATSIQIFPVTVMSLMATLNSQNPSAIFLPTLLSTFLSTFFGIILYKVFK